MKMFFKKINILSMFSVWMGESHAHLADLILIANCWAGGDQGFGMEVEKDQVITPIA